MRKTNRIGLLALGVAVLILLGTRTTADDSTSHVVVGMAAHSYFDGSGSIIYRVWNDGMVEKNRQQSTACGGTWCGWTTVPE